jgi:23S rRNA pseudouridine2605 synthase
VTPRITSRKIGLARSLSKLGYCSRATAFQLIRAGRVCLNGKICRNPEAPVHAGKDRLSVDGQVAEQCTPIYLMLNKPRGIVTTASGEEDRRTVYDYVKSEFRWVAPVGRLDRASEGLLLLTNDSGWAARILAPETHLPKTYHVQITSIAQQSLLCAIHDGVKNKAGDFLRAKSVRVLRTGERNSWLEIVLEEGKNRHIRRMLAEFRITTLRLVRVAIGPLALGDLEKGSVRQLTREEKKSLDEAMQLHRVKPAVRNGNRRYRKPHREPA